jgi:hypothetical protein
MSSVGGCDRCDKVRRSVEVRDKARVYRSRYIQFSLLEGKELDVLYDGV